jgi:hypothetical protein
VRVFCAKNADSGSSRENDVFWTFCVWLDPSFALITVCSTCIEWIEVSYKSTLPTGGSRGNGKESSMRLIKALGLATAAMAMMAIAGSGVASAAPHELNGFCLKNEPILCAAANRIDPPAGGLLLILAHSDLAELKNSGFFSTPEKCKSDVGISVKETDKKVIPGEIKELTFSECTGPCKKAESKGLPWKGELSMETPLGETWKLFTKEGGALLTECTFGTKCEYGTSAAGTTLTGSDTASGAVVKATNVSLTYKSGSGEFVCGPTGTWNAEYKATQIHLRNSSGADVGLHEPWWFTLLGEA